MLKFGTSNRTRQKYLRSFVVAFALFALTLSYASVSFGQDATPEATAPVDVVAQAIANTAKNTAPITEWAGPTSGPTIESGKKVVFVAIDMNNPAVKSWADAVTAAAQSVGWEVTVLDGKGTTDAQLQAMNQAIALQPDGIVTGAIQTDLFAGAYADAKAAGIPIVGIHSTTDAGAFPDDGLFWNVAQSTAEIGHALADYVIADSNGAGIGYVLTDHTYAISVAKSDAEVERFQECTGCTLVDYANSPLAEVTTRIAPLFTSWVQNQGSNPFYVMTIADYYYDFAVPALTAGGVAPDQVKLVGADGTASAYQRIREGDQYQVATVPAPLELQGYQAVDELNRAMHGEEPSGWVLPVYVVTKDNIDLEGGDQNLFIPSNDYKQHYADIWATGSTQ
ncbi:MAG: substrate-binding domain-containing protein [Anaerolineae bacterium]